MIDERLLDDWWPRLRAISELDAPVVVGCSGGADSTALLAVAATAALAPVAVHVDHGLRVESADESARVVAIVERFGVSCRLLQIEIAAGANVEARARDARYRALEEARADEGATSILVGHTLDDQAETVLLNLLRGSGSAGLAGMAARRGPIVRPLLGIRRAETRDLCARLGIEPFQDPSNADRSYRRAWVRHELIPMLNSGAARDVAPMLARQAEVFREESEFLDELARAAWPTDAANRIGDLAGLRTPVARRAVRCWLGSPPPSFAEVESVLAIARGEAVAVDLAGGRRVAVRDGMLFLERAGSVTISSDAAEVRA